MPTLTDEDRAVAFNLGREWGVNPGPAIAAYEAGLRAGMERAAKVCEEIEPGYDPASMPISAWADACDACAETIRAAINAE